MNGFWAVVRHPLLLSRIDDTTLTLQKGIFYD